jgi:hypothetical protein
VSAHAIYTGHAALANLGGFNAVTDHLTVGVAVSTLQSRGVWGPQSVSASKVRQAQRPAWCLKQVYGGVKFPAGTPGIVSCEDAFMPLQLAHISKPADVSSVASPVASIVSSSTKLRMATPSEIAALHRSLILGISSTSSNAATCRS